MVVLVTYKNEEDRIKNEGARVATNNGRNVVNSFLIGSSLFLQVTWTTIKSRMSSKFGQIRPLTAELAALARLEKSS